MILVIEDDISINSLLCRVLTTSGYEVEHAENGYDGFELAMKNDYELILMDLMLPLKSGEEVLRALRKVKTTPVIILSAKSDVTDRIDLFRLGADDYICKPFDVDEVVLRMEAVLRRTGSAQKDAQASLKYKDMILNQDDQRVYIGEEELRCTSMEYAILEIMLQNPNKVFSKRNLFESVTGEDYMSEDNTMNVHMSNLRKKIAKITDEAYIETVYGMGYRMAN
ncbi:MAG: response regulator transcription factor [Eubacteriales bacterium]|nr:response regulator transcription factor [Eubacteriales bacterium]